MAVTETGANDSIVGGANPMTVSASTATQIFAGAGNLNFVGGAGTSSILGGAGSESITAGSGGVVFGANGETTATVNSGTGGATIFGTTGSSVNLVGSGGIIDYLIAGAGNETLNASGSSSSNFFASGPGTVPASINMIGGSGNDTMVAGAGAGSTTMTGGAGNNAFVFFKQATGGASDVISDFNSNDSVDIEKYASTGSASALQNAATVGSGGVTLTLSDGTSVTFSNLTNAAALNGKIQYG
jgi:Ca2+-binding RTX toxin-like protein